MWTLSELKSFPVCCDRKLSYFLYLPTNNEDEAIVSTALASAIREYNLRTKRFL